MTKKRGQASAIAALMAFWGWGCGSDDISETDDKIDPTVLATYKNAIPSIAQLQANAPAATVNALIGEPAIYPSNSQDIVIGINGAVAGIIGTMKAVTAIPPTLYNSVKKEFLWGPADNEDGFGTIAVYIRDVGTESDFRYHYALLRGTSNDIDTFTPVIWGAATPDPMDDQKGIGLTLWDFEANYEFEMANDPSFDTDEQDRGRFVTAYGSGQDTVETDNKFTFVYAVFRNFVSQDQSDAEPADIDYYYGKFETPDYSADFIDYDLNADIDEEPDGIVEDLSVHMAFLNEGVGRADVSVSGGSFQGKDVTGVECWDMALNQTYLDFKVMMAGQETNESWTLPIGGSEAADCTAPFISPLSELDVPSLESIEPAIRNGLEDIAENGVPTDE